MEKNKVTPFWEIEYSEIGDLTGFSEYLKKTMGTRFVTSGGKEVKGDLAIHCDGSNLIDCVELTDKALRKANLVRKPIYVVRLQEPHMHSSALMGTLFTYLKSRRIKRFKILLENVEDAKDIRKAILSASPLGEVEIQ